MIITEKDLKEKMKEIVLRNFKRVKTDKNHDPYRESLGEYFRYCEQNYNDLAPEAKKIVDSVLDFSITEVKKQLNGMADSIEKRKLSRLYGRAVGTHFEIKNFIDSLDKKTYKTEQIIKETEEIFVETVQIILDWLHDITQHSLKTLDLVLLGLFYSAIDELLVAFHLAQHTYAPQSFSHIRTVLEILDRVDLFYTQPKWLGLWTSEEKGDEKRRYEEFKPSSIRKKLRKDKYDPLYGFFSEMGTHITFSYIKSKVFILEKSEEEKKMKVRINIGGSPSKSHLVGANSACVLGIMAVLIKLVGIYASFLLEEEAIGKTKNSFEKLTQYMSDNFLPWAKKEGLDASGMERFMEQSLQQQNNLVKKIYPEIYGENNKPQ